MVYYNNISTLASDWFYSKGLMNERVFVVCDENTRKLCWSKIADTFPNAHVFEIPPGEVFKTLKTTGEMYQWLLEHHAKRSDVLVAVGGGVVCDMVGFVASTYKRGVDCWYLPTTLLAMVDAAHGGKTGVNFDGLKNQVGTFSKPKSVLIDIRFLETLPSEELRSGKAEMLKHGLIGNAQHFFDIAQSKELTAEQISASVALKTGLVKQDFKEVGVRAWLNFGHTVGHALESFCSKREARTHGDCVAAGMLVESRIALKRGILNVEDFNALVSKVTSIFPKIDFLRDDIGVLLKLMAHDKKNISAQLKVVLLEQIGKVHSVTEVSEGEISDALDNYMNKLS